MNDKVKPRDPASLRCPYCHDEDFSSVPSLRCGGCGAWQHAECAETCGACGAKVGKPNESQQAAFTKNITEALNPPGVPQSMPRCPQTTELEPGANRLRQCVDNTEHSGDHTYYAFCHGCGIMAALGQNWRCRWCNLAATKDNLAPTPFSPIVLALMKKSELDKRRHERLVSQGKLLGAMIAFCAFFWAVAVVFVRVIYGLR